MRLSHYVSTTKLKRAMSFQMPEIYFGVESEREKRNGLSWKSGKIWLTTGSDLTDLRMGRPNDMNFYEKTKSDY